jgi:hypothetical protein
MNKSNTDWARVSGALAAECPSQWLRQRTVEILTRLERLGPLRGKQAEFLRVYRSLSWNEPKRIEEVLTVLEARAASRKLHIRLEAWSYTIAALDEWISHARVFYLVVGIIETALRTRLHERLTDHYQTEYWTNEPGAVPSDQKSRVRPGDAGKAVKLLKTADIENLTKEEGRSLLEKLKETLTVGEREALPDGASFLRTRSLNDLIGWFQATRFWEEPVGLKTIFQGMEGKGPLPIFKDVRTALKILHEARNEIAHYRPTNTLSFVEPMLAAARVANWLGTDLAHIYGSIDTRSSTELSVPLEFLGEDLGKWSERTSMSRCCVEGCDLKEPLAWMLDRSIKHRDEMGDAPLRRSCMHHRYVLRDKLHRPGGGTGAAGQDATRRPQA